MNYPVPAGASPANEANPSSDPARTSLIVTLWIAVFALPIAVFIVRLATGSIGWLFIFLALLSPFAFSLGALLPLAMLLVPKANARSVPIWTLWLIAAIHVSSLAVWGLVFTDAGDSDNQVSPFVAGAANPEHLASTLSWISAFAFGITYVAFIALAVVARATRRR